jgi:ADP-ribosylation factor GTPase-activating protein 2/3
MLTPSLSLFRSSFTAAISSDMYFERNDYDPTTVSAAQTRLQEFKGATSISSNQYFGEPGDEDTGQGTSYGGGGGGGGGGSGYLTAEGLQGLEVSARDALTRVVNSQEVQNLGEGLRNAGLKVRGLTLPHVGIDANLGYSYRITSPI